MSELSDAINEMRNMRESYDQIGAAAEAYNTGKTELAENITAKGVQASATETLPELAEKVSAISQETYEINGGEMYAKQLFGVANNDIVPGYWNLYDILAQLLSDGRLVNYGGILLAEYYRGYDSLALAGAGAGGAYVVSDKDENGQFKMYTEDTTHTWATEFDGKGNRWVAYCFADEYHDFQITDTNTSPRSIFIGRKVGTITALVNTRISEIVVLDGNELKCFTSSYTSNWSPCIVIKNLIEQEGVLINGAANTEKVYVKADILKGSVFRITSSSYKIHSIIIECRRSEDAYILNMSGLFNLDALSFLAIKGLESGVLNLGKSGSYGLSNLGILDTIHLLEMDGGQLYIYPDGPLSNLKNIKITYKADFDKTKAVVIAGDVPGRLSNLKNVELQDGWRKPLNIAFLLYLTKENVQAHIFDRLGVNDLSTGSVTITLANAVLNLFTQEEIDAVVARTNITIVGA